MVISTLSGKPLKVYPSINNASVSLTRFFFDLYEVDFYKYKEDVFYHEFTSDTIFKINHQLELEPHYVLGLGEKLPTLTEIRNGDAISKDKNLVFGHIMETDRWLLLSKSAWTHFFYLHKRTISSCVATMKSIKDSRMIWMASFLFGRPIKGLERHLMKSVL